MAVAIDTRILDVHSESPEPAAVGNLRFRGGLVLAADNPLFGGLSALAVSGDGKDMTAISDKGVRIDATLIYDVQGNLAGIEGGVLQRLRGADGNPLTGQRDADAEAVASGAAIAFRLSSNPSMRSICASTASTLLTTLLRMVLANSPADAPTMAVGKTVSPAVSTSRTGAISCRVVRPNDTDVQSCISTTQNDSGVYRLLPTTTLGSRTNGPRRSPAFSSPASVRNFLRVVPRRTAGIRCRNPVVIPVVRRYSRTGLSKR